MFDVSSKHLQRERVEILIEANVGQAIFVVMTVSYHVENDSANSVAGKLMPRRKPEVIVGITWTGLGMQANKDPRWWAHGP